MCILHNLSLQLKQYTLCSDLRQPKYESLYSKICWYSYACVRNTIMDCFRHVLFQTYGFLELVHNFVTHEHTFYIIDYRFSRTSEYQTIYIYIFTKAFARIKGDSVCVLSKT